MSRSGRLDRLRAAPLWVLFLYFSVTFGVMSLLLMPADAGRSGASAISSGLVFGVLMTGVIGFRRDREDRLAGAGVRTLLTEALRTGEAPSDTRFDPALLGLIEKRRRELHRAAKVNPRWFGGFFVLSLLLAFDNPAWLALAALFVGRLVANPRSTRRSEARLDELERSIRHRPADEPLHPGGPR
jgi:hypothetical protein